MTFGYNGDIYKNQSIAGIRGNARALLTRLRDERDEVDDGRPIVFLAHGLGGLIVKQVRMRLSSRFLTLRKRLASLVFTYRFFYWCAFFFLQALRFAENEATYKPITAATRGLVSHPSNSSIISSSVKANKC